MKVSLLLSIHNRSELFTYGLMTLLAQEFDPREWEILVLDDQSTEDLFRVWEPHVGLLNIRHIRINHERHPTFKEYNPGWNGRGTPRWWHTPALSTNIGIKRARGEVLWISQPEVLHSPNELAVGYESAKAGDGFWFCDVFHDDNGHVRDMVRRSVREGGGVPTGLITRYHNLLRRETPAKYWFSAFCRRDKALYIEGVREIYLRGVAAEDDDFRDRMELAHCPPKLLDRATAVHLYHGDEKEHHHRRDHDHWQDGLDRNRRWYYRWRDSPGKQAIATEQAGRWGMDDCVAWEKEYPVK